MRIYHLPILWRYVRYLPPKMLIGKLIHLVIGRTWLLRAAFAQSPISPDWSSPMGSPELSAFAEVYRVCGDRFSSDCQKLHHGEFVSNGVSFDFGSPADVQWGGGVLEHPKYSRWHHDLAYFCFAIPLLSQDADRGMRTVAVMLDALDAQLDADRSELHRFHWSPIAVASRVLALSTAVALVPQSVVAAHRSDMEVIYAHLWRSAEILKLTVERYLGFNHAATTEIGLAIGLFVQGKTKEFEKCIENFIDTMSNCVLPDGMWAERSPSYHIHMLVLLDATRALLAVSRGESGLLSDLSQRMKTALYTVVHPDGEIAIFNDAAWQDAPSPKAVGWKPASTPAIISLPYGGYTRVSRGPMVVIMDAGPMGPDAVIGHGHADFLSIEASVGGHRLIVDPGVASISPDERRTWTRSASAHNGPTVLGCEPAEFFGAWRVGRRGTAAFEEVSLSSAGTVVLRGQCDGYLPWGIRARREVAVEESGRTVIDDRWSGLSGRQGVTSMLIAGDWDVRQESASRFLMHHLDGTYAVVTVRRGVFVDLHSAWSYPFGPMEKVAASRLTLAAEDGVVTFQIEPRLAAEAQHARSPSLEI